jgi:aspartyl-tRNA(Asn)/glutamyl-tRNA(Gln) amidotransferase subunit A
MEIFITGTPTSEMGAIHYLSATTLAALIRTKQLSSREVVVAHLDRISAVNPKINAIVTLMADDALKGADVSDKAVATGADLDRFTVFRSASRTHSTPRAY